MVHLTICCKSCLSWMFKLGVTMSDRGNVTLPHKVHQRAAAVCLSDVGSGSERKNHDEDERSATIGDAFQRLPMTSAFGTHTSPRG